MKRTRDKVDETVEAEAKAPQWICFVRDDVGGGLRRATDPTFSCLFFFDKTSTPEADKILALFREKIENYDESINVYLHFLVNGHHPRHVFEYDLAKEPDPLTGADYEYVVDDDEDEEALGKLVEESKQIENFGTWKAFSSDKADKVDMACERVIRFYTKF